MVQLMETHNARKTTNLHHKLKQEKDSDCPHMDFSFQVLNISPVWIIFGIQCFPVCMINIGVPVSGYCILFVQAPVIFIFFTAQTVALFKSKKNVA